MGAEFFSFCVRKKKIVIEITEMWEKNNEKKEDRSKKTLKGRKNG
jgi:hypothetical protein